jgi:hypothetical protein
MPKATSERVIDTIYATQAARIQSASAGATVTPVVDHGALGGLADDDHLQYLLAATYGGRTAFGVAWTDLTDSGPTTLHKHDHGGQDGLSDDDHLQYALLAGRTGGQVLHGGTADGDALTLIGSAHANNGPVHIGGSTNYVLIAADGYLTLHGAAIAWDDLRIEPTVRIGNNQPTFELWRRDTGGTSRGVYLYSFLDRESNAEEEIHFSIQMPHAWAQTPIYIHVHWVASSTAATSRVRWGLEYTWAEPDTVFPVTQTVYADTPIDGDIGTTQYDHEITAFAPLSPSSSQDGLSSILICRLFRNSGNAADTYTGKAGLLYIDAHVQIRSFGSNDEYA